MTKNAPLNFATTFSFVNAMVRVTVIKPDGNSATGTFKAMEDALVFVKSTIDEARANFHTYGIIS